MMARILKPDGRKSPKNLEEHSDHKRTADRLNQFKRVLIACEGTATEPNYLKSLIEDLARQGKIAKTSVVFAPHKHTDPKGVLSDLMNYNKGGETYKDFEYRWIVIDRDEKRPNGGGHDLVNFQGVIDSASAKGVCVAYSNPAFEIWYLLHFSYQNTGLHRDDALEKLKALMSYDKSSTEIYWHLKERLPAATKNAKKLLNSHQTEGRKLDPANDNPSTTVHCLVEALNHLETA